MNHPEGAREPYSFARDLLNRRKFSEAFSIYRDLAAAGDPRCNVFLGWMYDQGVGVQKDSAKAFECFRSAALLGYKEGQFYCGRHAASLGKYGEALEWFGKAAAQQYGPALLWLGVMHLEGNGVVADLEKAVRYLRQAAETGNFLARRTLAVLMVKGKLGISQIPKGLILFPVAVIAAIWDAIRMGYTDRLIA